MVTRYFTDGAARHLVCWPFSIDALHDMARELGVRRCWYHAGRFPHYDVPKMRVGKLGDRVETISTRALLAIVKGGTP